MSKFESAWRDEKALPLDMLNGALGNKPGWKQLEEADHYPSLKECMDLIPRHSKILDIGCGAGDLGRVFYDYSYTGIDLPHIIQKVSKIKNPNLNFKYFDAETHDYSFMQEFECLIMNSFLSEIPFYEKCLMKVLINSKNFVIIHRQKFTNEHSRIETYQTYANLQTFVSILNLENFKRLVELNNFEIIKELNSFAGLQNEKTILLKKKND